MLMIWRMISLANIPLGVLPITVILNVSGTLNQFFPVAKLTAKSVEPTPVEKAPNAP